MVEWGPAECKEAYEFGASIDEICLITGISYSTMHGILKREGVTFRPRAKKKNPLCPKGHKRKANSQCNQCRAEEAKERYKNDPEYREKRLASSRKWKAKQKRNQNEDA